MSDIFEELDKIKTLSVDDSVLGMILDKDKSALDNAFYARNEYDTVDIEDGRYARHYKGYGGGYYLTVVDLENKEEVRDGKGNVVDRTFPISVAFVTLDHGEWFLSHGVQSMSDIENIVVLGKESNDWLKEEGYRKNS